MANQGFFIFKVLGDFRQMGFWGGKGYLFSLFSDFLRGGEGIPRGMGPNIFMGGPRGKGWAVVGAAGDQPFFFPQRNPYKLVFRKKFLIFFFFFLYMNLFFFGGDFFISLGGGAGGWGQGFLIFCLFAFFSGSPCFFFFGNFFLTF